MNIVFVPDGGVDALRKALEDAVAGGARSVQVLGAIENGWTPAALDPLLAALPVPVFGGVFPGVIFEGRAHERGAVVVGHTSRARVVVVDIAGEVRPAQEWAPSLEGAATVIAYLDATCPSGALMRALFQDRGGRATWCGGGAGALDFARRPVILTPDGLREGVAVLAGLDATTTLGVTHGWSAFGEPMLVTESEGNDVLTLDFRPAFEVYRETVERHSGRRLDEEGFFALASRYPLMLERFGGEGVVRDPLAALPEGGLRCAGDVPTHATVRVATGAFEDMLAAAADAREKALAGASAPPGALALTIDCISRSLLLGERLSAELEALRVPGATQVGALTIGEIASGTNSFLQVHNKTTVMALIDPRMDRE